MEKDSYSFNPNIWESELESHVYDTGECFICKEDNSEYKQTELEIKITDKVFRHIALCDSCYKQVQKEKIF